MTVAARAGGWGEWLAAVAATATKQKNPTHERNVEEYELKQSQCDGCHTKKDRHLENIFLCVHFCSARRQRRAERARGRQNDKRSMTEKGHFCRMCPEMSRFP